jgi:tetratricopeptide (TPR) repeat protein
MIGKHRESRFATFATMLAAALLLFSSARAQGAGQDVPVAPRARLQEMVKAFAAYHARPPHQRAGTPPPSYDYPALSKKAAEQWRAALWDVWRDHLRQGRNELMGEKDPLESGRGGVRAMGYDESGKPKEQTMRYYLRKFGKKPQGGWPLYINLHSGGDNKDLNDRSWQATLNQYPIQNALYVCPRSVADTGESWYDPSVYALLTRLTMEAMALWDVNPDRIYLMGYSMGGWGTFHLGPAIPDYWAAVAATAGAGFTGPTGRSVPDNLRNLPMMIQIGTKDTAFRRYALSRAFAQTLQALRTRDPGGYVLAYKEHKGAGHAVNDRNTPAWLARHTRQPWPEKIVWQQIVPRIGTTLEQVAQMRAANAGYNAHFPNRSYWLRNESPNAFQRIVATRRGNRIELNETRYMDRVTVLLDDRFVNLDQPVEIATDGKVAGRAVVPRRVDTLLSTLTERGDPQLTFSAQATVPVPDLAALSDRTPPKNAEELLGRAAYRVTVGRFREALDDYTAALDANRTLAQPSVFQMMLNIAQRIEGGDTARTLDIYRRWAAADPNSHMVARIYAYMLLQVKDEKLRDLKTARAMAERAVRLSQRKDPMNLHIMAQVHYLQGELDQAIAVQREGVKLFPAKTPPNILELRKTMEERLKVYETEASKGGRKN